MAIIATTENPLRLDDLRFSQFEGAFINWLTGEYPNGFDGRSHVTLVNGKPIAVKDYDVELKVDDKVILAISPNGAELGAMLVQAVITAAVSMAVSYVVSALFGPKSIAANPSEINTPAARSVYSLNTPTNQAKLGSPIPVIYGTVLSTPDLASQPYFWYESNEQYLAILLCLGQGEYDVHSIQVADTPINQMPPGSVYAEVFPPSRHNKTFGTISAVMGSRWHENVDTSPEVGDQEIVPSKYTNTSLLLTSSTGGNFRSDVGEITAAGGSFIVSGIGGGTYTIVTLASDGITTTFTPSITNWEASPQSVDSTGDYSAIVESMVGNFTLTITAPDVIGELDIVVGDIISVVITSDGDDITASGELLGYDQSTFTIEVEEIPDGMSLDVSIDATSIEVDVDPNGRGKTLLVRVGDIHNVVGPFSASAPGRLAELIQIDFNLPNGLYALDQETGDLLFAQVGIETVITQVDDLGVPTGTTITRFEVLNANDNTPQRRSFWYPVPQGRYFVSVRRTNGESGKAPDQSRTVWVGLKSWLVVNRQVYGDTTLVALTIKATNGVASDAANRIGVTCTRKLNGAATRAPSAAYLDIVTNTTYGAMRPISEVDSDVISTLDTQNFDAIYDFSTTTWEALTNVCAVSHAAPIPVGAVFSAVVDKPRTTIKFAFKSSINMVTDSLSVNWIFDNTREMDGYEVEYRDTANLGFQTTYAIYPNNSVNPEKVVLFGCTDETMAYEHAKRLWNRKQYRRKFIEFLTELEGHLPQIGDLISVEHELFSQGVENYIISAISPSSEVRVQISAYMYDGRVYQ